MIRLIATITCGVDGSRGWGLRLALVPTEDNEAKLPSLPAIVIKDNVIRSQAPNVIKDNVIKDNEAKLPSLPAIVMKDNVIRSQAPNVIKDNEAKLPSLPSKGNFIKDNVVNEMLSRIIKPSFLLCRQIFELPMSSRIILSRMMLSSTILSWIMLSSLILSRVTLSG